MKIRIVNISDNPLPEYKTIGSAGMDLMAAEDITFMPHEIVAVPTGLFMEMPEGYEGQVRSRSGLSLEGMIVNNAPGTIDSDYRGQIKVILRNQFNKYQQIKKGDRIAQLIIAKVERCEWELLSNTDLFESTDRGDGGFGSTGR